MEYVFAEGPYRRHLESFVAYKLGKGEKGGRNLQIACRKIAEGLADEPDDSGFGEAKARAILTKTGGESDSTREHRVAIMRQFCAFLNSMGIPCWQVPPKFFVAPRTEFRPYILSKADISALLLAADSLAPSIKRAEGYDLVYPVLVRLLLSSGLRISEALSLDADLFDAEAGTIHVVNSKNGVSRIVPLSAGMSSRLHDYLRLVERDSGPVFKSPYTGQAYSYDAARYMFRKLYDIAGIVTERGRRPRIHDLRHTFCTMSLDKMLASGMSTYEAVPILAAYVGHVNYADTEKYIHFTKCGHGAFVESERSLGSLIPKAVV